LLSRAPNSFAATSSGMISALAAVAAKPSPQASANLSKGVTS
jgi:hypothetical protein